MHVSDIDETRRLLVQAGAKTTREIAPAPTGRMMYARHPDGALVEYVQWTPELVEHLIYAPNAQASSRRDCEVAHAPYTGLEVGFANPVSGRSDHVMTRSSPLGACANVATFGGPN